MGWAAGDLYGHDNFHDDYKIRATTVEGAAMLRETATNTAAEVDPASTTGAADFVGLATENATFTSTQSTTMVEGVVRISYSPFMIWGFEISGGAAEGTALVDGVHILTNDTENTGGTVITEADVGTALKDGGIIKGKSGANAGVERLCTTFTNNTSVTVVVPFPNTIGVGDKFIILPFSRKTQVADLTTNLLEVNGLIAREAAAGPWLCHRLLINEQDNTARFYGLALDQLYNPA